MVNKTDNDSIKYELNSSEPTGLAQYIANTQAAMNKEPVVRGLVNALSDNPVFNGIGKVVSNPYFQKGMSDAAPIASMLVAPEFLVARYGMPIARGLAGFSSYAIERAEDVLSNTLKNPYANIGFGLQDTFDNIRKTRNALKFIP